MSYPGHLLELYHLMLDKSIRPVAKRSDSLRPFAAFSLELHPWQPLGQISH